MLENALKSPYSHLVINHLPIFLLIMGCFLLLFGFLFKNGLVKRLALSLFVFTGIAAILSMNTGEGAEEIVEGLEKASGTFIHQHEEHAETFSLVTYLLSAISILSIWLSWKKKQTVECAFNRSGINGHFCNLIRCKNSHERRGNNA